ncbi:MAG: [protein-PII] uridylyltransferase [Thermodesulfobacteriota bacterium]
MMNDFLNQRRELMARPYGLGQSHEFTRRYAALLDGYLKNLFEKAMNETGSDASSSLVALGGYGRAELAPHSDVDLLFLTASPADQKKIKPLIEAILYPLWDLKLDVGQAVRTPVQCLEMAREDFTALAAQLDSRYLAGDEALFHDFDVRLHRWLGARSRRMSFFKEIRASVKARHTKYGASCYLLEPNVKEGQGALRDIHTITWTASGLYGLRTLTALTDRGLLSRERLVEIEAAKEFLTDVRFHLHRLTDGKNDTLTFELQEGVAQALSYQDNERLSGVERFMQEYYRHTYQAKSALDYFLSRVQDNLTPHQVWSLTQRSRRVERGLNILRGQIELGTRAEIRQRPLLMMRAYEVSAASGLPISQRSLELIRNCLDLVDDEYRRDPQAAAAFLRALTAIPPKTSRLPADLDAMQYLHFLEAYLPELAGVRAQVQHDAYHVYTVDVHLLATLWELKKIALGLDEEAGGFERDILEQVKDRPVLFLAALLHDIGKGHGRDHARRGAEMIPEIGKRLGLSDEAAENAVFLVAEHLFLIETATRRDLTEEKLIVACARRTGDLDRLNMLYLLTVADSRATGPGVLNPWKLSLLRDLYSKIHRVLTRSDLAAKETAARTERLLTEVVSALEGKLSPDQIDAHLASMSAYYLSIMNTGQVVRHILLERSLKPGDLIWEVEDKGEGYCEATIVTQDRPGLLTRIAGIFTLHHINILGAQVFTRANNIALNIFQVSHPPDRVYEDRAWARLKEDARRVLSGRLALDYRISLTRPLLTTAKAVIKHPNKVVVDNETSDFHTIVEVYTYDRLGLLYEITKTFFDLQLAIHIAKISTKVDQVVDVFYVRDCLGQKIMDEEQIKELNDALLFTLER